MFNIHDNFKGTAYPTEDVIDRIAKTEGNQPIILPLRWVHEFFGELDRNPLQLLFPNSEAIDDLVLIREKKRKANAKTPDKHANADLVQPITVVFPQRQVAVNKYLGAEAPIMRITGLIKSSKDKKDLMRMWWTSRSYRWQWFSSEQFLGKVIVRDLTIDKKTGVYTVDICKYYGNKFS
jgi:hypothetical protein